MSGGSASGPLALVLSGGGSKGALQVGMYRALCEVGLEPDFIVGSSVGALNGALLAAGVGPRSLARGWTELSRSDLFRFDWSLLRSGAAAARLRPRRRAPRRRLPGRQPAGGPGPRAGGGAGRGADGPDLRPL